jgi:hypothetical protein
MAEARDMADTTQAPEDEADKYAADIRKAMALLAPKVDSRKGARKDRRNKQAKSGDRRTLSTTGRTEQLNFQIRPELLALFNQRVPRGERAEWFEEKLSAWLEEEAVETNG